ncbi:unnamed protein product, partial [Prorocentrum cordatum]
GFCAGRSEIYTEGVDRPEAANVVAKLKAVHVGEFQLRRAKDLCIRIPMTPTHLWEIANTWNDHLKEETNNWRGQILWVLAQPHPAAVKVNSTLGKVADFATSEIDATCTTNIMWKP